MRIATSQWFKQATAEMQARQVEMERFRHQVSSGKRLRSPADDPAAASRILALSQTLEATGQYQTNANAASSRLTQTESALDGVTNALQRVRELVIQGRNAPLGDAERGFIASELRQRLDEILGLANTIDGNGEYLFAGFQTGTRPFSMGADGEVSYFGDEGRRRLQIGAETTVADSENGLTVFMAIANGNGRFVAEPIGVHTGTGVINPGSVFDAQAFQAHSFRVVFTAADSFDVINDSTGVTVLAGESYVPGQAIRFNGLETSVSGQPEAGDEFRVEPSGSQSMFATLNRLIGTLETPHTDPRAVAAFGNVMDRGLAELDQALGRIIEQRAAVGSRLRGVDAQILLNENLGMQLTELRSQLEDADLAEAISGLNLAASTFQAAQLAFARIQQLSLFNFL